MELQEVLDVQRRIQNRVDITEVKSKPYYGGDWLPDDEHLFVVMEVTQEENRSELQLVSIAERELNQLEKEFDYDEKHTGGSMFPIFTRRQS